MTLDCSVCGRDIPERESFTTVSYEIASAEGNTQTIEESDSLLIACQNHPVGRDAIVEALTRAGLPAG